MFIELKSRVDEPGVRELLEFSGYPDEDWLRTAIAAYRTDAGLKLYGIEEDDELIGLIGYRGEEDGTLTIAHLAVSPEHRGLGYGRGLILEMIGQASPTAVVAETDEEAVDFYRNIGFEIESLGEKYPGVERFKCTYDI